MDRRAELKRAYKETQRPMGVFQILNTANGKRFVGAGMDLPSIFNRHRFMLNLGGHHNKSLQEDWRQYGEESFSFEVLELLKTSEDPARDYKDELSILEQLWLAKLQPYGEGGYN